MALSGVYTILNLVTGRRYVGSSVDIPRRWREHLSALNRGQHCCAAMQTDWQQYGASAFSWVITEECSTRADAIVAEQIQIDSTPDLYNAARRAGSGPRDGFRHTDAAKLKVSERLKGRPKPAGFGATVSAWKRGRPNPAQSRALTGRKLSPAHCEKIRIANTGKRRSEAFKAHMRAVMTGRVITWGAKISASKRQNEALKALESEG